MGLIAEARGVRQVDVQREYGVKEQDWVDYHLRGMDYFCEGDGCQEYDLLSTIMRYQKAGIMNCISYDECIVKTLPGYSMIIYPILNVWANSIHNSNQPE
jgi:hypothetical protein